MQGGRKELLLPVRMADQSHAAALRLSAAAISNSSQPSPHALAGYARAQVSLKPFALELKHAAGGAEELVFQLAVKLGEASVRRRCSSQTDAAAAAAASALLHAIRMMSHSCTLSRALLDSTTLAESEAHE